VQWIGTISTGAFHHQIQPGNSPSENGSWERACPAPAPLYKGVLPEGWNGTLPGVRVRVIIRPPPFELTHGEVMDPEPSPGPLVLRAEPDLPGDPWREWQAPDFAEIIGNQVFVDRIRVDPVPGLPDPHDAGGSRFEDEKIIREIRVRILLPPVSHPLCEFFCFGDCSDRLFSPGHFLMWEPGG